MIGVIAAAGIRGLLKSDNERSKRGRELVYLMWELRRDGSQGPLTPGLKVSWRADGSADKTWQGLRHGFSVSD